MTNMRIIYVLLPLTLLIGCSSNAKRETSDQQLATYMQYAGPPVDRFTYLGHIDGWTPIDNHHLLIRTGVRDAYLVTVAEPCIDLPFAMTIGLTSTSHTVYRGFDSVLVGRERCTITEIRPIDYRKMREGMKKEARARKAA
jgi:hypothetical protein